MMFCKRGGKMSDMKLYEGYYSYEGAFKQNKDGTSSLNVRSFTYGGKYYHPNAAINFIIRDEPEGWISVRDDSIGVIEGGKSLEEALGNAFMMTVAQYEDLACTDEKLTKDAQKTRERFQTWEVHAIDSKAQ